MHNSQQVSIPRELIAHQSLHTYLAWRQKDENVWESDCSALGKYRVGMSLVVDGWQRSGKQEEMMRKGRELGERETGRDGTESLGEKTITTKFTLL